MNSIKKRMKMMLKQNKKVRFGLFLSITAISIPFAILLFIGIIDYFTTTEYPFEVTYGQRFEFFALPTSLFSGIIAATIGSIVILKWSIS